jgi:hypothetical protein
MVTVRTPNSALVSDACASALVRASCSAPQRER